MPNTWKPRYPYHSTATRLDIPSKNKLTSYDLDEHPPPPVTANRCRATCEPCLGFRLQGVGLLIWSSRAQGLGFKNGVGLRVLRIQDLGGGDVQEFPAGKP